VQPAESFSTNVFKPTPLSGSDTVKHVNLGAAFTGKFNNVLKGNRKASLVWQASGRAWI